MHVTAHGIALRDELLLLNLTRACASAAASKPRPWRYTDDSGDVLFVPPDTLPLQPADGIIQVVLAAPMTQPRGFPHVLHLPLRAASFMALLDRLQQSRSPAPGVPSQPQPVATEAAPHAEGLQAPIQAVATPIDLLARRLREGSKDAFQLRGNDTVWTLAPALKLAWAEDPASALQLPAQFSLHDIAPQPAPPHALPLEHLLWHAANTQPDPQPARHWHDGGRLGLRRWPDFGRFGRDPVAMRLSAVCARGVTGVAALEQAGDTTSARVIAFLNAVTLLDLLTVDTSAAAQPPSAPPQPAATRPAGTGVFARIRAALGLR